MHFAEARFGFRAALEQWPDNPRAQEALTRPRIGAGARVRTVRGVAFLWSVIPLLGHLAGAGAEPTRAVVYGYAVGLLALTAVMVTLMQRSLGDSEISRKLTGWLLATPVLQGLQAAGLDLLGVSPKGMLASQFFLWGVMVSTSSLSVHRLLLLPGLTYLGAYLFAVQLPEARYLVMAVPNTVLALTVLWIYERQAR